MTPAIELSPAKGRKGIPQRSSFAASRERLLFDFWEQNALRIHIQQVACDNTRVALLQVSMLGVRFFEIRFYIEGRHRGRWSATTTFWSPAFKSHNKSLNSHDDYQVQLIAQDFLGPLDFKRTPSDAIQEAA